MARFVTELLLRNYKSIARCKLRLDDLTILVGPNGAGKSNIIDALRFVSDAVLQGLDFAFRHRGGIDGVRRRSTGHPTNFGIRLNLKLEGGTSAFFAFEVGAQPNGAYAIQRERAHIGYDLSEPASYEIKKGEIISWPKSVPFAPKVTSDRLFLVAVSGIAEFRPLFDVLARMQFYNINPAELRSPQAHEAGDVLSHGGRNIASVIKQLQERIPNTAMRIEEFLQAINPLIEGVEHRVFGPQETLEFKQKVQNNKYPWRFLAHSMSDGTLRSIGLLTALFQETRTGISPTLIGLEEPEITIHPGAAAIIMDALLESSVTRQIVSTTHSPDFLDHPRLNIDNVRVVKSLEGETIVRFVDNASRKAIREQLYTPGELLRLKQLLPEPVVSERVTQSDLFGAN